MASIGDVFLTVLADANGFEASITSQAGPAADRAGKTLGSRLSAGLRVAIGAAAGAAFGLMIQQGQQLDAATQKLAADTGLSGQALAQQGNAIDNLYKTSLLSMDSIEGTLAQVISGFDLQGQAADDLTASILKYEEATGQGSEVTASLKQITDAYNLSATDEGAVMDLLVASHQQYGTSITADQDALAAMGPALDALDVGLAGGVDLLNLFAAAGVSATRVPIALNTAIKNLKPGQTLDDLIAQLSSIQDPTLRAQAAIKDFGSYAGPKLAQAIQPGITGLEDYATSADDTVGASNRAAQAIENSWGNRITLIFHNVGGTLATLGEQFGPLLYAGMLVTPKLAAAFGGIAGALIPVIAQQLGLTLPTWLGGGVAAGAATVTGEAGAVAAGGPAVAAAVLAQGPEVAAAGEVVGTAAGGGLAAAIAAGTAVALPALLMVALAAAAPTIQDWLNKNLNIHDAIFGPGGTGPLDQIGDWADSLDWPFGPKNTPVIDIGPFKNILGGVPSDVAASEPDITDSAVYAFGGISHAARDAMNDTNTQIKMGTDADVSTIKNARSALAGAWSSAMDAIAGAQTIGYREQDNLAQQADITAALATKTKGKKLTDEEARQQREQRAQLQEQYALLLVEDAGYGTNAQKAAKLAGLLQSKALKDGLASTDPDTVTMWQAVQSDTQAALDALTGSVSTGGNAAGTAYGTGFTDGIAAGIANGTWATSLLNSASLTMQGALATWHLPGGSAVNSGAGVAPAPVAPKVKAFAVGTPFVPYDMPAFVHRGEAIIPAAQNKPGVGGVTIGTLNLNGIGSDVSVGAVKRFAVGVLDEIAKGMQVQNSRFSSYSGSRP